MIYLNKKQIVPAILLINFVFMPLIIPLLVFLILYKEMRVMLITGILLLFYVLLTFIFCKIAYSKKNYLIIKKDCLEICCGNKFCDKDTGIWIVPFDRILQIDYYKINSLKGWFILWSYLLPQCVFLTVYDKGQKQSVFIGYMDLAQVRNIVAQKNLKLICH